MDPIWDYLVEGTLPNDSKEASKLRVRSARFTIHQEPFISEAFLRPSLSA